MNARARRHERARAMAVLRSDPEEILSDLLSALRRRKQSSVVFGKVRDNRDLVPNAPGVYLLSKRGNQGVEYVGEAADLRERLAKTHWRTTQSALRRNHGYVDFSQKYLPATKSFSERIEERIDQWQRRLKVCWLQCPLGRLELEEYARVHLRPRLNLESRAWLLKYLPPESKILFRDSVFTPYGFPLQPKFSIEEVFTRLP